MSNWSWNPNPPLESIEAKTMATQRIFRCAHSRVIPPTVGAFSNLHDRFWSLPMPVQKCPDCGQQWFFLRRRP